MTTYMFNGSRARILLKGADTGGAFGLAHITGPAGGATPPHLHTRDTEVVIMIDGYMRVETGGAVLDLGPGEAYALPAGRAHRLSEPHNRPHTSLLLSLPPGFIGFIEAAGTVAAPEVEPRPPTADEVARIGALAAEFGIEIVSPDRLGDTAPAPWRAEPGAAVDMMGVRFERLLGLGGEHGHLAILRGALAADDVITDHAHAEAETVYVLEGRVELWRDTIGWTAVEAGQAVHVPGEMRHALRHGGGSTGATLLTFTHNPLT